MSENQKNVEEDTRGRRLRIIVDNVLRVIGREPSRPSLNREQREDALLAMGMDPVLAAKVAAFQAVGLMGELSSVSAYGLRPERDTTSAVPEAILSGTIVETAQNLAAIRRGERPIAYMLPSDERARELVVRGLEVSDRLTDPHPANFD